VVSPVSALRGPRFAAALLVLGAVLVCVVPADTGGIGALALAGALTPNRTSAGAAAWRIGEFWKIVDT